MELKAFEEFVYIILVNASQTASHEEAQVTHTLLSDLSAFYKHMITDDDIVLLTEEINALRHYFGIQKIRYGKRFDIYIHDTADGEIFIERFAIINFVDNTFNSLLNRYECFFRIDISVVIKERTILLEITVDVKSEKEFYRKSFIKRGGRLCTSS